MYEYKIWSKQSRLLFLGCLLLRSGCYRGGLHQLELVPCLRCNARNGAQVALVDKLGNLLVFLKLGFFCSRLGCDEHLACDDDGTQ